MAVRLATLLAAAAQEPHVPDPEVGRIVDAVAAQFVAAGGRGFDVRPHTSMASNDLNLI